MKKLKLLCSAIAALALFALASCDLEIRDYFIREGQKIIAESDTSNELDFKKRNVAAKEYFVFPENFSLDNGISVSFKIVDTKKNDWDLNFLQTDSTTIYLSVLRCGSDIFESNAKLDANISAPDGNHTVFYDEKYFVTISFEKDGGIVFYRDGARALTYEPKVKQGALSVKTVNETFLDEVANSGLEILQKVEYLHITECLDDVGAEKLNASYATDTYPDDSSSSDV